MFDFDYTINDTLPTKHTGLTSLLWQNLYHQISPHSNTGLKSEQAKQLLAKSYKDYPLLHTETVYTDKGLQQVAIRRPAKHECCVIDWVSFTMKTSTFDNLRTQGLEYDSYHDEIVSQLSDVLQEIFGFKVEKQGSGGRNRYEKHYLLEHDAGFVCIGGQNNTLMVSINGDGCTYGNYGWEADLHAWLNMYAVRGKITRIDLSYDDLTGETISVDWANEQDDINGFNCGGRNPSIEYRGNWKRPDNKGRSLYIGSRKSSKYTRFYEKGKQLGDPTSSWVRCEVEYKSKHLYIPFDVLIYASEFFLASYPCFHVFDNQEKAKKFERIKQDQSISFERAVEITQHQFGRYLYAFRDIVQDDTAVLDMLMPKKNKFYPDRLDRLTIPYDQFLQPEEMELLPC